MYTTTYLRPMSFVELVGSTIRIYLKSFWPLWIIYLLTHFGLLIVSELALFEIDLYWYNLMGSIWLFLPALFIGPATLTISNIILGRPKRIWSSLRKGMSPGMILKIFVFFSPLVVSVALLLLLGINLDSDFGLSYLLFSLALIFLFPLWVFYPTALLLEKKNIFQSLRRIMALILGQLKRLVVIHIFLLIPIVLLLGGLMSFTDIEILSSSIMLIAEYLALFMPVFFSFAITMYILHYYQVRAEKENFNEELLAQELGYEPIQEMMTV